MRNYDVDEGDGAAPVQPKRGETVQHRLTCASIVIVVAAVELALCLLPPAFADAPSAGWDPETYAVADRAFSVQYPRLPPQGSLILSIDHRAFQPMDEKPFSSLLGFDSGNLTIGLGVRYSLLDSLDIGVERYNATVTDYDTYEFNSRFQLLAEDRGLADIAIGGGLTWFDAESLSDEYGGMAEVLIGRTLFGKLYVTSGVMYHSRPAVMTGTEDVPHYSAAVLATANLLVMERVALVTEWSIPVAGAWEGSPAWSAGPKVYSFGHTFSLVVSNAHDISDDRLAAGSTRWNHPIFGFTITRQL